MSEDFYIKYIQPYDLIIYKVCRAYTNNEVDFKDYYQEICLQIWKSRENFKNNSKYSTWIYRLSLNVCLSIKRKEEKAREIHADLSYISVKETIEEAHFSEKENQLNLLYSSIKKLKKVDRAIILLYLEKHSYAEIAEIIGVQANNIGVKINRIKKQLKTLMYENA